MKRARRNLNVIAHQLRAAQARDLDVAIVLTEDRGTRTGRVARLECPPTPPEMSRDQGRTRSVVTVWLTDGAAIPLEMIDAVRRPGTR